MVQETFEGIELALLGPFGPFCRSDWIVGESSEIIGTAEDVFSRHMIMMIHCDTLNDAQFLWSMLPSNWIFNGFPKVRHLNPDIFSDEVNKVDG